MHDAFDDADELARRARVLRAEARHARAELGAAIEKTAQAVRVVHASLDAARTRQAVETWKKILRTSGTYMRWCEAGRISPVLALSLLGQDLADAGFEVDPAFVMAWQRQHTRGPLSSVELSLPRQVTFSLPAREET